MSIRIEETFQVAAPAETVWRFLLDPQRVVTCLPGAELEAVVDERTFEGAVKTKLGAVSTRYRGRVRIVAIDEDQHVVEMLAEGRETGGGTVTGRLTSELHALPDGRTQVVARAQVDLTGRVMQVGRGMIQGVSKELFAQFALRVRDALEAPAEGAGEVGVPRPALPARDDSIPLLRVLLRAAWASLARLFGRLRRRPARSEGVKR
jgi:uncharacterized protein